MALNTAHLADFCNEGCQLSTRLSLSGQDWHLNLLVSMNEAAKLSMKHFFQSIAHGLETALVVSGERLLSCKNKDFITWKLVRQSILQLLHLCTMEVCTPVAKEPENARPSTKIPILNPLHVASLPAQQSRAATDENGPISWAERPPHQPHRTAYAIWRDCQLGIPSTASATRLLWNPVVTCCNSSGKVCTWTLPRRSRPQCPATIDSVDKEPHHPPGGMSYFTDQAAADAMRYNEMVNATLACCICRLSCWGAFSADTKTIRPPSIEDVSHWSRHNSIDSRPFTPGFPTSTCRDHRPCPKSAWTMESTVGLWMEDIILVHVHVHMHMHSHRHRHTYRHTYIHTKYIDTCIIYI